MNLQGRASDAASSHAGVLSVLNLLIWHTGSSGAIPLGAFFSLVSLWFIISIPLCYSGAAVQKILTERCHHNCSWGDTQRRAAVPSKVSIKIASVGSTIG